jgi:D-lactate dehydrogenase (cytochrome)
MSPDSCPRIEGAETIREQIADILADESKLTATDIDRVYFPESVDDVVAAVKEAAQNTTPVTISAARTGITGGAVPVDTRVVISLQKMNSVLRVGVSEQTGKPVAVVQAGVTLDALRSELASFDWASLGGSAGGSHWHYPVDPTEWSAAVGGTIATNASGARSYHYGPTRDNVNAVKVVLADGRVVDVRRGAVKASGRVLSWPEGFDDRRLSLPTVARPAGKCAAGFMVGEDVDLIDLFIGSEGTLGIIVEAELKLSPSPAEILSLMCFLPPETDALKLVRAIKKSDALAPLAIEYLSPTALQLLRDERAENGDDKIPELPSGAGSAVFLEQAYETEDQLDEYVAAIDTLLSAHGGSIDDTWAGEDDAEREKMRLLRHGIPEAVNNRIARRKRDVPELHKVGTDLAVSDEAFAELATAYETDVPASGLEYVIFGHVGENHLHVNLIPKTREELDKAKILHASLARRAAELGGAVTAEHGIGRLKRDLLTIQYGAEGVAALKAVKDFFDPDGLFNPGVLFEAHG